MDPTPTTLYCSSASQVLTALTTCAVCRKHRRTLSIQKRNAQGQAYSFFVKCTNCFQVKIYHPMVAPATGQILQYHLGTSVRDALCVYSIYI